MKFFLRSFGILIFSSLPFICQAEVSYTPLQPIITQSGKSLYNNNLLQYLANLYSFAIAIAGGLAVLRIVFAGIKYMTSDAFSLKTEAKKQINASIIGLLMALGSYAFLYTLNPKLVELNLNIAGTKQMVGDGKGFISASHSFVGPAGGLGVSGKTNLLATDGTALVNPALTAYSPQKGGDKMEGGYESSKPGLDGQSVVRTLDDYVNGDSLYVTLAGDPSQYGKTYTIPSITYTNSQGVTQTLTNVTGYVHDTGSAFEGAGTSHFDVAIGRDYSQSVINRQSFSR